MPRILLFASALWLLCATCGCSRSKSLPNSHSSFESGQVQKDDTKNIKRDNDEKASKDKCEDSESGSGQGSHDDKKDETAAAEALGYSKERILLVTPGGPLIVELQLKRNGRPFYQELEKSMDAIRKAADSDEDGKATWDELVQNEKFHTTKIGVALTTSKPAAEWKGNFDGNADGQVDLREIERLIDDNMRTSPFLLETTETQFSQLTYGGRVFANFDADKDEALSAAEISSAVTRMWQNDVNGDGVLLLAEITGASGSSPEEMQMTDSGPKSSESALRLHKEKFWMRNLFWLQRIYGIRGRLSPESFAGIPKLFSTLDKNGDKRIREDEFAQVYSIPAHLTVSMDFIVNSDSSETTSVNVDLVGVSPDLEQAEQRANSGKGHVHVDLGFVQISYVASAATRGDRIRLVVNSVNDGLFMSFDENGDGRLTIREAAGIPARLESIDLNQDGVIVPEEIPIHLSLVASRAGLDEAVSTPNEPGSPEVIIHQSGGPDWFDAMDSNQDGDLSPGEFLGTTEQFKSLDGDSNDLISVDEAATSP